MYNFKKCGEVEIMEPKEMPESTRAVLMEVLSQNKMLLQANCEILHMISLPIAVIHSEDDGVEHRS